MHVFFLPADAVIIGGDFNCYECDLDKFGGNVFTANYSTDFCSAFSLTDIWLKLHPCSHEVSWFNSNFTIGSRLINFLFPGMLLTRLLLAPFRLVVFPTMIMFIYMLI